jgi:hypothetical protein
MTDYKNIFGKPVKFLATDPDNAEAEGQIWYNSTDGAFKDVLASKAWASAAPIVGTGRDQVAGTTSGTVSAGMIFGGDPRVSPYTSNETDEYNGSGWSAGGTLNTGRNRLAGAGTLTAGLAIGGGTGQYGSPASTAVEEYNGTAWTAVTGLPVATRGIGGCGIQTAALGFGGLTPTPGATNVTHEYNGSAWTSGGNLVTARYQIGGVGIQTAALGQGGFNPVTPGAVTDVESYDGASWTAAPSYPVAVVGQSIFGTQTSNISVGGVNNGPSTETYEYDGTSYTDVASTANATAGGAAEGGTSSAGAIYASKVPVVQVAEEYNKSANVITAAAWSSGGNLNTSGRNGSAGSGIQTAAIIAGGGLGSPINNSESYDGSSWTNLPTLGTARGYMAGATSAPATATVVFGGSTGAGGPYVSDTEEYNGSSWTEQNNMSTGRNYLAGFGTQTAAVAAGGSAPNPSPPSRQTAVEEYDGTNWTAGTALPTATAAFGGCGTLTAGLVIGDVPMQGFTYDGSSWTSIPTLNIPGNYNKAFGTQTSAIQAGRNDPNGPTAVEEWDGTSWFTQASLATGRFNGLEAGTTTAGLVAGPTTATEEFTGETSALNVKTITTS